MSSIYRDRRTADPGVPLDARLDLSLPRRWLVTRWLALSDDVGVV